jgi:TonB-dependent SusC/RagA subfamily outer membrane receptor
MHRSRLHPRLFLLPLLVGTGCAGSSSAPAAPKPEQVQIGYDSIQADHVTGSVSSLTEDQIRSRNVVRVEDLFEGISGVDVARRGGNASLSIRGAGGGDTAPLLVIDGIQIPSSEFSSALNGLAPQDIARIDVIKDGSAAIYGRRGGAGVILIRTKQTR